MCHHRRRRRRRRCRSSSNRKVTKKYFKNEQQLMNKTVKRSLKIYQKKTQKINSDSLYAFNHSVVPFYCSHLKYQSYL
jgi:hypothetical protein